MINITKKFRKALFNDQRNYKELVTILLSDGTRLELTNENLLEGVGFDDMVSEDNNFQIGAAIINSASVKINNMYDDYTDYNFDYAKVYANVGLDFSDGTSEVIRKFTAYVDEAKYNGSAIELSCMDYMGLFDRVYDGNLGFPNTTLGIIQYCCTRCGITLGTPSFPRDDVQVAEHPDFGENCTYRQIISWVAQQSCCFARCDAYGQLEIKWYDMDSLNAEANRLDGGQFDNGTPKYQTGDHADGGGFMTNGDQYDVGEFSAASLPVHVLNGIFSCEVCKDPVTITGISVTTTEYDETTGTGENATTERKTYTAQVGTTDYLLAISGNPLISTPAMATEVANYIASKLVGFTFWIGHVSHLSDPSIEAGDVMLFSDYKGVTYRGVVSSTSFKCGESQTTDSSAETPNQNTKTQRSGADAPTQAIMEIENWLHRQKSAYELGILDLSNRLDAEAGIHVTKQTASGSGDIWYLHDKPELDESTKVIKVTADAIGFSTDGGQTWNSGMTINGGIVARVLKAKIVQAGWGIFDTITDDAGNTSFNLKNGTLAMRKGSIKLGAYTENGTTKYHFSVDDNGSLNANNATIKGSIEATSLTLASGVKIPYASVSGTPDLTEYIKEDGTIGSLPSSGATDTSLTGFRVSSAGLLKAANAIIYGTIYSSAGRIGGWTIASNKITKGTLGSSNSFHIVADGNSGSASLAGSSSKSNWCLGIGPNFGVDTNGYLYASGANISGRIQSKYVDFETTLADGWAYFKYNNSNVGKIGAAIMSGGNAFNLNMMSGASSFGVYSGDGSSATALVSYHRSDNGWTFWKDVEFQKRPTYGGSPVVTMADLNIYNGGTIKWADGDDGHTIP